MLRKYYSEEDSQKFEQTVFQLKANISILLGSKRSDGYWLNSPEFCHSKDLIDNQIRWKNQQGWQDILTSQ